MIGGTNAATGSGGGLNFSVVGGTAQPSGKENTVWVNTSTAISGYAVSATEPKSPTEGMVWLLAGTSAAVPLNVDAENIVMIYPTQCTQYISGAWASKTAMTYADGAWVNWRMYLYNNGDLCTDVTGGWTGTTSSGADYIQVTKFNGETSMRTAKAVDFSGYTSLTIEYKYWGNPGAYDASYSNTQPSSVKFQILNEAEEVIDTFASHSIPSQIRVENATISTATLDVSSYNEPCILEAVVRGAPTHQSYGGSASINLYEAKLE